MIYFFSVLFAASILFGFIFGVSLDLVLLLAIVMIGLFFYGIVLRFQGRATKIVPISITVLAIIILSFIRILTISIDQDIINDLNGKPVSISGQVSTLPEERENRGRVVLGNISIDGQKYEKIRVLLWHELGVEFKFKDQVSLQALLKVPENFETNSGRIFEYTEYLSKDDIYFEVSNPRDLVVTHYEGFSIGHNLDDLKQFFISRVESVLPEPHSSLSGGILLGEKQSLGKLWQEKFRTVGLTHIVVLSGYNISIVVSVILYFLSGLSLIWSSIFGILGIILFAILVGGGATVVRASIMAAVLVIARYFNRPYDALRALFLAGFLMILLNPRILIHDLSFQLSFLATLGIILFSPVTDRLFSKISERFGFREILSTTLSAQLFVLPWIVYTIGDFSLISFLANILVLPAIPLAMLFSFISGILPIPIIALPAYLLLDYVLIVTDLLSKVPYASIVIPKVPLLFVVLVYVLLIYLARKFN